MSTQTKKKGAVGCLLCLLLVVRARRLATDDGNGELGRTQATRTARHQSTRQRATSERGQQHRSLSLSPSFRIRAISSLGDDGFSVTVGADYTKPPACGRHRLQGWRLLGSLIRTLNANAGMGASDFYSGGTTPWLGLSSASKPTATRTRHVVRCLMTPAVPRRAERLQSAGRDDR